ncbi:MAG: MFS transporter [Planctomycetota bacterium]
MDAEAKPENPYKANPDEARSLAETPKRLWNRGFLGLMTAQFHGAMNDNILKVILTFMVIEGGLWFDEVGSGAQGIVSICFTVPFMLLGGFAGQLADRYSKRKVAIYAKVAEIPIAVLAGIGFYVQDFTLTLVSLTLLTCQSAFFGPAKYGMIPELVSDKDLSRANGANNMLVNVAVILGTVIAGAASDAYFGEDGTSGMRWLPGALVVGTAIIGVIGSTFITPLAPGNKNLKLSLNPFETYIKSIREMSKTRLLMVMMAWGYFYLLAGVALLILPEYHSVLAVTRAEASVLMGVLGVAIGCGCAAAGMISGDKINPRLTVIGAVGLVLFFFLLGVVPPWMPDLGPMLRVACSNVAVFILFAGFFAGFYIIPLQALLQKMSPEADRGQFLATASSVSFAFFTVAGLIYTGIRDSFGDEPHRMFLLSSVLMLVGAGFFIWKLRGTGILIPTSASEATGE